MAPLDGVLRRIGASAVSGIERHWSLIPPDLARRVRPAVVRVGDGVLTLMETSDSLRMNRVVALGHRGAAKESMIDTIVERYRAAKLRRFSFELCPGPQSDAITRWLMKRGFTRHGGYTLLLRDCRVRVPRVVTEARVKRARGADLEECVAILAETFGIPASRRGWSMAAARSPDYEHFLARVGPSPAGVGASRVDGDLLWLGGGATRTRWRRRGVHRALIAARLRHAARLGCRWAWSETGEPRRGRPDGSRRNLMSLGFEPVISKPIFVWGRS